jgi:hypothetical protein
MNTPPSNWAPVEQHLWQAMREGKPLDLGGRLDGEAAPQVRSKNREVDADVLASLLLQPPPPTPGVVSRLQLVGAHITGRLRLRHAAVSIPVALVGCRFDEPVELDNAWTVPG